MRAAKKAGHVGNSFRSGQGRSRSRFGRGRRAAVSIRLRSNARRVVTKARVVRHQGPRFRSAPLPKHIAYLKREGVTKDGQPARMFDAAGDEADERAFAERCKDDRHHFRFIVSPEDAAEIGDLKTFTRELVTDMERDLGTQLDWVAVDHWNTDNPHVHLLIRGRADDGQDLVISRDYISRGIRDRAAERITLELGPRTEQQIHSALQREVEAERWTSLDRALRDISDECGGVADLRPGPNAEDPELRRLLLGRAAKLERLGESVTSHLTDRRPRRCTRAALVLLREANAVTDNPLVFHEDGAMLSGGNFHAEPVALAADAMATAIAEVGAIAERRIAMLIDSGVSRLPPFLTADAGLNSGFMIAHVTAASLASENKSLAHPASVDSLPTSANQEDHVSMATFGARRLQPMIANVAHILGIELLAAAQGIEFLRPMRSSAALEAAHALLRARCAAMHVDRFLAPDIEAASALVRDGDLAHILRNLPSLPALWVPA